MSFDEITEMISDTQKERMEAVKTVRDLDIQLDKLKYKRDQLVYADFRGCPQIEITHVQAVELGQLANCRYAFSVKLNNADRKALVYADNGTRSPDPVYVDYDDAMKILN